MIAGGFYIWQYNQTSETIVVLQQPGYLGCKEDHSVFASRAAGAGTAAAMHLDWLLISSQNCPCAIQTSLGTPTLSKPTILVLDVNQK